MFMLARIPQTLRTHRLANELELCMCVCASMLHTTDEFDMYMCGCASMLHTTYGLMSLICTCVFVQVCFIPLTSAVWYVHVCLCKCESYHLWADEFDMYMCVCASVLHTTYGLMSLICKCVFVQVWIIPLTGWWVWYVHVYLCKCASYH